MGETKGYSQSGSDGITPLLAPLLALQRLLEQFENRGVIIGGIAASLLGQPRFTADLGAVVILSVDDIPELLAAARDQDIVPRMADAEAFARKNRVLLLHHPLSGINIDISLGILPFEEEMVARSRIYEFSGLQIRLPTPEDLIILKAVAHRPQDMLDIQAIAASHPDLDQERVRFWVAQFGEVLEIPDLWDRISQLFNK
jgi:hypothetical protein